MSSEGKDREKRCLREVAGVEAFTVRQLQVVKQTRLLTEHERWLIVE